MDLTAASIALNVLAFLAAGAYSAAQTRAHGASPVDQRIGALAALMMALVGVRAWRWQFGVAGLQRVEEALAALLPLFALFLAEGLLRRHAPGWVKNLIVAGAALFVLAALLRPGDMDVTFAYALGGFVSLSLLGLCLLLALRNRQSLSAVENQAIGALFAGVVVGVPLSITDFMAGAGISQIRAGGLGVMVFILALTYLTARGRGALGTLEELGWSVLTAVLGTAIFAWVFGETSRIAALTFLTLLLGLVLLSRIVQLLQEIRRARSQSTLWRAFAEAPTHSFTAFLDRMLDTATLQRARLLEGAALDGYDQDALTRAFGETAVMDAAQTSDEQLSVLLDEHEATHAVLLTRTPLRLLFFNLPRVGAGADADLQLRLLAKLAAQAGHA
jgi:hypothetical protein